MLQTLHTEGLGPFKTLDMTFGSRLNLITGDNGYGKSLILDSVKACLFAHRTISTIRNLLFRTKDSLSFTYKDISLTPEPLTQLIYTEALFPDAPLVFSVPSDGSFEWSDPYAIKRYKLVGYTILGHVDQPSIWKGLGNNFKGLFQDWISWHKDYLISKMSPLQKATSQFSKIQPLTLRDLPSEIDETYSSTQFEALQTTIHMLWEDEPESNVDGPYGDKVPTGLRKVGLSSPDYGNIEIPYVSLYGNEILITDLSAGMKRIISLAYMLVWFLYTHKKIAEELKEPSIKELIILIDEIELHLHPKWQRKIVPALLKAVECLDPELKVQIIATTHSPMVTASLEPLFDPDQDKLFTLELEDGEVKVYEQTHITPGTLNDWAESPVFNSSSTGSDAADNIALKVANALHRADLTLDKMATLESEMVKLLPPGNPLWSAWEQRQAKLQREASQGNSL